MKKHSRVCAEISLDNFEHNLDEIKKLIAPGTKVAAVIKTDAYGHGAVSLAHILETRSEIWGYAVATIEEAVELRDAGIKKPVLILGYTFPEDHSEIVRLGIRPAVFSMEAAMALSAEACRQNRDVRIHIKLDTGMSRIGFQATEETAETIVQIAKLPHMIIEGIFTHFAKADEIDKSFTRQQAAAFFQMDAWLKERGISIPIRHISNSAGIIDLPEYNLDMVRAGIILYGLWPSDEVCKERIDLKPLMTIRSHVVHVKELGDGRCISYGGTYQVKGTRIIATIPVGYGDGYPRALSNKGYVLIHGQKAPVCGRICMDQFMVDVTGIGNVKVGDEVVLIGTQGERTITIEEAGEMAGRFNYEFACDLGKRIPRVSVKKEETVAQISFPKKREKAD